MIFASTCHLGLVKKENEDALGHLENKHGNLFVVCDGVGGLPNGALASQTAVDSIISAFPLSSGNTPDLQLQYAMENGQKSVMKINPKPLGTTVVACYYYKDVVYTSWCGDSRIYHFRDSRIVWISKDHNVLHDLLNKGEGVEEIFMNPHALTRYFGMKFVVKSDYYSFQVQSGDQILLCSDGLSNFLSEPDIIHAVTNNFPQDASNLMEKLLITEDIGAPDNFSWYIIQI